MQPIKDAVQASCASEIGEWSCCALTLLIDDRLGSTRLEQGSLGSVGEMITRIGYEVVCKVYIRYFFIRTGFTMYKKLRIYNVIETGSH